MGLLSFLVGELGGEVIERRVEREDDGTDGAFDSGDETPAAGDAETTGSGGDEDREWTRAREDDRETSGDDRESDGHRGIESDGTA
jgi:hypothetical protein